MKTLLLLALAFTTITANAATHTPASCEAQYEFQIEEPIYVGEHSLWKSLKVLFENGADYAQASANAQIAGLCTMNFGGTPNPHDAVVGYAPALLAQAGDKFVVLLERSYSLDGAAWHAYEPACLRQISTLKSAAEELFAAPAEKITFYKQNGIYFYNMPHWLKPSKNEPKIVGENIIVKRGEEQYCVFKIRH